MSPPLYTRWIAGWRNGRCRASCDQKWEWDFQCGNVEAIEGGEQTSWGSEGAVRAPAGYGTAPRSKKYVSKMKKKNNLKLKDMLITRCCVPRSFLCTHKLLTDDCPIVQAFWWNIVFNPWTHGFFITINSMILYFKHIIHIDDFPLNGHPPSVNYSKLYVFYIVMRVKLAWLLLARNWAFLGIQEGGSHHLGCMEISNCWSRWSCNTFFVECLGVGNPFMELFCGYWAKVKVKPEVKCQIKKLYCIISVRETLRRNQIYLMHSIITSI